MISGVGLFDQKLGTGGTGLSGGIGSSGLAADNSLGTSFSDLVTAAATRTVDRLNNAEDMAVKAMQGGADTREVVDAVMTAEQSLQAAIAIRDKIVSAYLDISRMAI